MRSLNLIIALALIFGYDLDFSRYLKIKEKNYTKKEDSKYASYRENSYYKKPYINNKRYYNKVPQIKKYSMKSLRGLEIKNNNKREKIRKSLENKL